MDINEIALALAPERIRNLVPTKESLIPQDKLLSLMSQISSSSLPAEKYNTLSQETANLWNQRSADLYSMKARQGSGDDLYDDGEFKKLPYDLQKNLMFFKGGKPALDAFELSEGNKIKRQQSLEDYKTRMALQDAETKEKYKNFPTEFIKSGLTRGDLRYDPKGGLSEKFKDEAGQENFRPASLHTVGMAEHAWPNLFNQDYPFNKEQKLAIDISRKNPKWSKEQIEAEVKKTLAPAAEGARIASLQTQSQPQAPTDYNAAASKFNESLMHLGEQAGSLYDYTKGGIIAGAKNIGKLPLIGGAKLINFLQALTGNKSSIASAMGLDQVPEMKLSGVESNTDQGTLSQIMMLIRNKQLESLAEQKASDEFRTPQLKNLIHPAWADLK